MKRRSFLLGTVLAPFAALLKQPDTVAGRNLTPMGGTIHYKESDMYMYDFVEQKWNHLENHQWVPYEGNYYVERLEC